MNSRAHDATRPPRVSIGLPVYNGEDFLAATIESVLAQTFTDVELIISDNASTDSTPAICQRYAATDSRVKYYRSKRNLGAAPNYHRTLQLSAGQYFKWNAHDDLIAPNFVEQCVDILDQDASSVLCMSQVGIIDDRGAVIDDYAVTLNTQVPDPAERFRSLLLDWHMCFDIFGLIRANALKALPEMGGYSHADGVLLNRLCLLGRFHMLPEVLFWSRRHSRQSMSVFKTPGGSTGMDYQAYALWFDAANSSRLVLPVWRMLMEYSKTFRLIPTSLVTRLRCQAYLARWMVRYRRALAREALLGLRDHFGRLAPAASKS